MTIHSLHVDGPTLAFAWKLNLISLLCKPFSFLSKFCKFWDLCLGKQGAWLVLHPLPLVWRLPTQVCCWSDLFLVLCTPQGIEESLLSQNVTHRSAPSLDDTSRTLPPVTARSFTRNGQVLTKLQAFLACLTCVSLVSHIQPSKD